MREILFRGKRVDNGEWVISDSILRYDGKIQLWQEKEGWVFVIPETVGEYTGLTDKNGKKIFEGDIIECEWYNAMMQIEHRRHLIIFSRGSFCAEWYIWQDKYNNYLHDTFNRKVIGNIYDNPELLEVKE